MFSWMKGRRSKETLKDRLELVLAYDRAKIPPGKVEALRNDLLEVVRRYFRPATAVWRSSRTATRSC